MAKDLDSAYNPGVRGKSWLKLKHVISLDLVIVAADWGYGRRHGWLSNYHLAARDVDSGEYLVVGKTFGIALFGSVARLVGFPLPDRMGFRELLMAGYVAALGLTVALFVASAAFVDPVLLGQGKMGALFSGFVGLSAVVIGRALGIRGAAR